MKKILIIDDEITHIKVAKIILEKARYKVIYALDGIKGIELCRRKNPSLVLLDLKMPIFDGIQVCVALKLNDETAQIPVVICTGKGDMDLVEEAYLNGAVDYVLKPFDSDNLLARLAKVLKQ